MQNVPNIVRERLKVSSQPVHHLGADMLTAFADVPCPRLNETSFWNTCRSARNAARLLPSPCLRQESPLTVASPSRGWLTWPTLRSGICGGRDRGNRFFRCLRYQRQSNTAIATNRVPPPTVSDAEPEISPYPLCLCRRLRWGRIPSALNATLATSEVSPSEVPASKKALPRANESAYARGEGTARRERGRSWLARRP